MPSSLKRGSEEFRILERVGKRPRKERNESLKDTNGEIVSDDEAL